MKKIIFKISLFLLILVADLSVALPQIPEANEYVTADIPCRIQRVLNDRNMDSVRLAVLDWINGNENCVLGIIDWLADYYIENSSFTAFSSLAAVCNNAEGKIAEYLVDINGTIFYANFATYASYLNFYRKHYGEDHCMSKYLVSAIALQIAASANESKERSVILEHIKRESKKAKLPAEITDYMISLYEKADPAIWK